ncbi:MAG: beta-phosphoglucomutase [Bacteroidetes bacterium]|nr:MAG: beta-phosphoglucomutase [Bacteroidota bacterium]
MTEQVPGISGCIFNMDGVLVNTGKYHFEAWHRVAAQLGIEYTEDFHLKLKGMSRMACLEQILEHGNLYIPEAEKMYWADIKNNWYLELITNMKPGEVLPGVLFFLRQLREMGIRIALSSASQNARSVLRSLNIESFFDVIMDGNTLKKPKPDPQCFLLPAHALELPPVSCVVFEDTPLGVHAGLIGGFTVVGVGDPNLLDQSHLVISGFENLTFNTLLAQLSVRVAS